MVIDALITTRILVQFIGQIGAVTLLRKTRPEMPRPYRMWLYPLPSLVALLGWIFLFATSGTTVIAFGLVTLLAGVVAFFAWSWRMKGWPFAPHDSPSRVMKDARTLPATRGRRQGWRFSSPKLTGTSRLFEVFAPK